MIGCYRWLQEQLVALVSDIPSGRSTAVIALTIGKFLFTAATWSNPITFALLVL
jgi:hypothetical protein